MRSPFFFRCVTASFIAMAAGMFSSSVHAEMDYEYAQELLQLKEKEDIATDDLIERLIVKLESNTTLVKEGKLIKATFKRKQALKAGAEKKTELLNEAAVIYKELLADDPKWIHYPQVDEASKSIVMDHINATIKASDDLKASNPEKARQMRVDAAEQVSKIAEPYKIKAAEYEKDMKDKMDGYIKAKEKAVDENGVEKPIARNIEDALIKAFDLWYFPDQKYVLTKTVSIECYDDATPAKKTTGLELAKYIETRTTAENYPANTVAWYNYMLGRVYASMQDVDKAKAAWEPLMNSEATTGLPEAMKSQMAKLQKMVLHDYVKMVMKIKKYDDVVTILEGQFPESSMASFFEEQQGKELVIDYVMAKTIPVLDAAGASDYEKAVKKLREMIEKETKSGVQTPWSTRYARTMAEILQSAQTKKIPLRLSAVEWYNAAFGFFLIGQNEHKTYTDFKDTNKVKATEAYTEAVSQFQNAVDYYRRAITKSRAVDVDLATRFEVEPKAWGEMALAYIKMGNYYEAIIAYQALRKTFLPDFRKKWMPDASKAANNKIYTPKLKLLLTELDSPAGLLVKSGKNMIYALDQNVKVHKDPWNRDLKQKIFDEGSAAPEPDHSRISDKDYLKAQGKANDAKEQIEEAKTLTDAKVIEGNYTKASNLYIEAAELFSKIPEKSEAYESALYQTASTYTIAQSLWAAYRFPSLKAKTAEEKNPQELKSAELAKKALDAFDKYVKHVAAHPAAEDEKGKEDKERRDKLESGVFLARPTLLIAIALLCGVDKEGAAAWSEVIKAVDAYVAYEVRAAPEKSKVGTVLINKFHALMKLAGINLAPDCDPYLVEGEKVMKELRKLKPNDQKLYGYMLDTLSARYNYASFQAKEFIKKNKMAEGTDRPYEDKVAELQVIRVDMKMNANDPNDPPILEDYCRLVYLLDRSKMYKRAADTADKLLKLFDPKNLNVRLPETEVYWRGVLGNMVGVSGKKPLIQYRDAQREKDCQNAHKLLLDYMFDTILGRNEPVEARRPDYDKKNLDLNRAKAQLETIKKNYPDVQTLTQGEVVNGVATPYLKMIEEEIDFRQKIEATRDLLSTLALKVADVEDKEGRVDEAKKYRTIAFEQIDILLKIGEETPSKILQKARIAIATEKYESALNALWPLRDESPRESIHYFDASRLIAEVNAKLGKWEEAAIYPKFLVVTSKNSPMTKERWPELDQFLEECYKHGIARPVMVESSEPVLKKPDEKDNTAKPEDKKTVVPTDKGAVEEVKKEAAPEAPKEEKPK